MVKQKSIVPMLNYNSDGIYPYDIVARNKIMNQRKSIQVQKVNKK